MKKQYSQGSLIIKTILSSAIIFAALSQQVYAQSTTDGGGSGAGNSGTSTSDDAGSTARPAAPVVNAPNRITARDASVKPVVAGTQYVSGGPQPVSAFQNYVVGVTGTSLSIFGSNLFDAVPSTFAPGDAAQVNQDYIIGTGDLLQIRGWGMVDIDVSVKVDRSGAIYIPRVGSVNVSGVRYRDLQGYLKQAVGKIFTNFELTASIAQVRSVQIYVVGHAVRPGTYTLSAMSTLLNALFTSGGPDATGSMRNIEVKRGMQIVTRFDLYDMLVKGDKSHDITLQDGDVVYIPEVGPLVALTGNVKRQAIFEIKERSAPLADVINWAGGFGSSADAKQVIVEKNINNNYQTIATLTADESGINNHLAQIFVGPADVLRVFSPTAVPIEASISNAYVKVSGSVKQSGIYRLNRGETLRALIARIGGLAENAYVYATELERESVRRTQQAKLNEVAERFSRDLEIGATQKLASTTDASNISLITASLERQRALAQRMMSVKAKGRIVLEMENGDAQLKNLPEIVLRDGDTVFIPSRPDTVDVLGAVFQQNTFIYRPSRNLSDYVALAGGATQTADASQLYVIRADGTTTSAQSSKWFSSVGGTKINPGDTIVMPEEIAHTSWMQSFKEWTTIFYQFGLGAAGLKVLQN